MPQVQSELLTIKDAAGELGVSRPSVSDAIQILQINPKSFRLNPSAKGLDEDDMRQLRAFFRRPEA